MYLGLPITGPSWLGIGGTVKGSVLKLTLYLLGRSPVFWSIYGAGPRLGLKLAGLSG